MIIYKYPISYNLVDGELLINLPVRINRLEDAYQEISSMIDKLDSLIGER